MRSLCLVLVAAFVVGCGAPEPTDWCKFGVGSPAKPAAWHRLSHPEAGMSFDMPDHWMMEDGSDEARQTLVQKLSEAILNFQGLDTQRVNAAGIFYNAVDVAPESLAAGYIGDFTSSVQQLSGPLAFKAIREKRDFQPTSMGAKPSLVEEIKTPLGPILHMVDTETRLNLKGEGWTKMTVHSFYFGRERLLWQVIFAIREGDEKAAAEMMQIVNSIRISKPNWEQLNSKFNAKMKKQSEESKKRNQEEIDAENRRHEALSEQRRLEILEEERLRQQQQQQTTPEQGQTQAPPIQDPPPTEPPVQNPPTNGDGSTGDPAGTV